MDTLQLGLFPASDLTQRWLNGKARWYAEHAGQPSVSRGRYVIEPVSPDTAAALLEQHHYLGGRLPGTLFMPHGVRDLETGELVGVASYGPGGAPGIRKAWFPSLFEGFREKRRASCAVLDRFCLLDGVPANAETHILKLSFARAREEHGVLGIVSFSDPVARRARDGSLVFPGHVGTIYKGKGMIFTGRTGKEQCVIFRDGRIQPRRSLTAWANAEKGHTYVYGDLLRYGAEPILPGEDRASWLSRVLPGITQPFVHGGMYRYVARLDAALELSPRVVMQPYPSRPVAA